MAEIFNKNTYTGKYWDVAVAIHRTNAAPLDSTEIFTSYDDALAYAKSGATAYFGQCVTVAEIEDELVKSVKPYVIVAESDGKTGTLQTIATGSIDIKGDVVNIYYDAENDKFYNLDTDPEHTSPLTDVSGLKKFAGVKQYLRLTIGSDDVYIATEDLIDLSNYYTKTEVDKKIDDLDSSVSDALEVINSSIEDIKEDIEIIDSSIAGLDASVKQNAADIANINSDLEEFEEKLEDVSSKVVDLSTAIDTLEAKEIADVSSLKDAIDALQDSFGDLLDAEVERAENAEKALDSSIKAEVARAEAKEAEIDSSIEAIKEANEEQDARLDILDASVNALEETLRNGVVSSISTNSLSDYVSITETTKATGDVELYLDASVQNEYDPAVGVIDGLATTNYVEDRLEWITIDED